jgi:NADH:ubiquinone oxidoreductase subunit H
MGQIPRVTLNFSYILIYNLLTQFSQIVCQKLQRILAFEISGLMVLMKTFKDFFKYVMRNIFIIQSCTQCMYTFLCIISVKQTIQYKAIPFPSKSSIAPTRITRALVFHQLWVNLPVFHPLKLSFSNEIHITNEKL